MKAVKTKIKVPKKAERIPSNKIPENRTLENDFHPNICTYQKKTVILQAKLEDCIYETSAFGEYWSNYYR